MAFGNGQGGPQPEDEDIDFGQYDDQGGQGGPGGVTDDVLNGMYEGGNDDGYGDGGPNGRDMFLGGDGGRGNFQGDQDDPGFSPQDGDDQYDPLDPRQRQRSQAGAPQRRGPMPGFMGAGSMSRREQQLLGDNFWQQPGQQQQQRLTPDQQFFQQLTERLANSGNNGNNTPSLQEQEAMRRQQDTAWGEFFGQRNFGMNVDAMIEAFTKAGNDPQESTRVLHNAMQSIGRDVYRQLATDMQPTIMRMAEAIANQIVDKKMQNVNSERSFQGGLTTLLNRNPQWRALGEYPANALKQALVHSNGDLQRAIQLTERHIADSIRRVAARRNTGNNRGGVAPVNWHNEARG